MAAVNSTDYLLRNFSSPQAEPAAMMEFVHWVAETKEERLANKYLALKNATFKTFADEVRCHRKPEISARCDI